MPMHTRAAVATVFAFLVASVFLPPVAHAQQLRIEIFSRWDGSTSGPRKTYVISGSDGKYKAGIRPVDSQVVAAFLAAVHEPPAPTATLAACGITQSWLSANANTAMIAARESDTNGKPIMPSPEQAALFHKRFEDFSQAQSLLDGALKRVMVDDDPFLRVTISEGGTDTIIKTDQGAHFLLPWLDGKGEHPNYNCRISTALGALLPKDFLNRQRLVIDDPDFIKGMGIVARKSVQDRWDELEQQRAAADPH
jgi:hypothetical protein